MKSGREAHFKKQKLRVGELRGVYQCEGPRHNPQANRMNHVKDTPSPACGLRYPHAYPINGFAPSRACGLIITHKSCQMPSVPAKPALPRHWSRTWCAVLPSPACGRGEKTAADQARQRHPAKL